MKIIVFLQGTLIMHKNAVGKTRQEILKQVQEQEDSVRDFRSYVPIGHASEKLQRWTKQGAEICYLSALTEDKKARGDEVVGKEGVQAEYTILDTYGFPKGNVFHRQKGERYKDIVERIIPDVLIEDDCESIGGEKEMTITFVMPAIRQKIKSVVVPEFFGIDHLTDNIRDL